MLRGFFAAVLAAVFACAPAMAVVVSTYSGTVSSLDGYHGAFGSVSVGANVDLTFFYDPRANPGGKSASVTSYYHGGGGEFATVTDTYRIGSILGSVAPTFDSHISILNLTQEEGGDSWGHYVEDRSLNANILTLTVLSATVTGGADFLPSADPRQNFHFEPLPGGTFFTSALTRITIDINTNAVLDRQAVKFNFTTLNVGDAGEVPEPTTWAMMIAGFGLVGWASRKRGGRQTNVHAGTFAATARHAAILACIPA